MIKLWPACVKVLIMLALKLFTFAMLLMIISLSDFQLKILGLNLVNQGWDFRMIWNNRIMTSMFCIPFFPYKKDQFLQSKHQVPLFSTILVDSFKLITWKYFKNVLDFSRWWTTTTTTAGERYNFFQINWLVKVLRL